MSEKAYTRLCPARPSEVKRLGRSLVDQLLKVEHELEGVKQFQAKKEIIAHFEQNEPDLFNFFISKQISPYQFLVKVQKAFEQQSDVSFCGHIYSKSDAVSVLKRYIPNLQYLHDNQLYTHWDSLKELGTSAAIGVVATGIIEAIGRQTGVNPYLSMEMALTITFGITLVAYVSFVVSRNSSVFHKAPWNSAIYLVANLHESNPENWKKVTWPEIQQTFNLSEGFTFLKSRPHYAQLDAHYRKESATG